MHHKRGKNCDGVQTMQERRARVFEREQTEKRRACANTEEW